MKKYISLLVTIIIASSCNTDDVITEELEDHYRAKTSTSVAEQEESGQTFAYHHPHQPHCHGIAHFQPLRPQWFQNYLAILCLDQSNLGRIHALGHHRLPGARAPRLHLPSFAHSRPFHDGRQQLVHLHRT